MEKIVQISHVKLHQDYDDSYYTLTYVLTDKGRIFSSPTDLEEPENWIEVELPIFE